jgi:hypothetical protein
MFFPTSKDTSVNKHTLLSCWEISRLIKLHDRLCGLVVSVAGCRLQTQRFRVRFPGTT